MAVPTDVELVERAQGIVLAELGRSQPLTPDELLRATSGSDPRLDREITGIAALRLKRMHLIDLDGDYRWILA